MPYRRLPNTDVARLKALRIASEKGEEISPVDLAFSQSVYYRIQSFLPKYERTLEDYTQKKQKLSVQSRQLQVIYRKARMFLFHFIQVTFFSVQRGEHSRKTLAYFGLSTARGLPSIQTYEDMVKWGQIILGGEERRTAEGKSPITNPTAAVVKVRYEQFTEALYSYLIDKKTRDTAHQYIIRTRKEADQIIARLWDNIEGSFADLPDRMKRRKAAEYGVTYVYRTNEPRHIDSL